MDIKLFRTDPDLVRESQRRRFRKVEDVDEVIALDEAWRKSAFSHLFLNYISLAAPPQGRPVRGRVPAQALPCPPAPPSPQSPLFPSQNYFFHIFTCMVEACRLMRFFYAFCLGCPPSSSYGSFLPFALHFQNFSQVLIFQNRNRRDGGAEGEGTRLDS